MLPKLGIIAGSGALPVQLAEACEQLGRPYVLIAIDGAADAAALAPFSPLIARLGAVGETLAQLRAAGAEEVVLAGGIKRPSVSALTPDAAGVKLMARLGLKLFGGDDALLKALVTFLEEEGFRVVGADAVLGGVAAPSGLLSARAPDAAAQADIALGFHVAKTLGALDIGQAVIVEQGIILGVEAAEGTDALIARCAPLQRENKRAVLVKASKPGQERRVDLPAAGPETMRRLHAANMLGLAVEAGAALLLNVAEMRTLADAGALIFVSLQQSK